MGFRRSYSDGSDDGSEDGECCEGGFFTCSGGVATFHLLWTGFTLVITVLAYFDQRIRKYVLEGNKMTSEVLSTTVSVENIATNTYYQVGGNFSNEMIPLQAGIADLRYRSNIIGLGLASEISKLEEVLYGGAVKLKCLDTGNVSCWNETYCVQVYNSSLHYNCQPLDQMNIPSRHLRIENETETAMNPSKEDAFYGYVRRLYFASSQILQTANYLKTPTMRSATLVSSHYDRIHTLIDTFRDLEPLSFSQFSKVYTPTPSSFPDSDIALSEDFEWSQIMSLSKYNPVFVETRVPCDNMAPAIVKSIVQIISTPDQVVASHVITDAVERDRDAELMWTRYMHGELRDYALNSNILYGPVPATAEPGLYIFGPHSGMEYYLT
jgi:hypothetical protein